jgi:hypothetical protein
MSIEPLESRIAPAAVFHYTDLDGDLVSIAVSKAKTASDISGICVFSTPIADNPRTLRLIDFSANAALFSGTNLTITVKHGPGISDGVANIGRIDAVGSDGGTSLVLGTLKIAGDLGQIDAGLGNPTDLAVKSITVRSLGRLGTFTQVPGGNLNSQIFGRLGALTVQGDFVDSFFVATRIDRVTISGSLLGGDDQNEGRIFVGSGGIGRVKIGGNIEGGDGEFSGAIQSNAGVASLTVGGSIIGRAANSGAIQTVGQIGPVKIAHDLIGGEGVSNGFLRAGTNLTSVKIGGSILAGHALETGSLFANLDIGPVKVAVDIKGGNVGAGGRLASVTIGGSLVCGDISGGQISGNRVGPVKIGHDLIGGPANAGGYISSATTLTSVTIGGSIIGGSVIGSGSINADTFGPIKIGGDLRGGSAQSTGAIINFSGGNTSIASLTIGGSIIGGSGVDSGFVDAGQGGLGPVKIGNDIIGGSNSAMNLFDTGMVRSQGRIASITLGGSLISGIDDSANTLTLSGAIAARDDIGSLTIRGSVIGHPDTGNGASPAVISARGQKNPTATSDVAIGRLTILGRVDHAQILAGYDVFFLVAKNADAQVGKVKIGGDWIASSLAAGSINLGTDGVLGGGDDNLNFGDANDAKIADANDDFAVFSKIASITIGGQVYGTLNPTTDRYGFVAEEIVSFKVGGFKFPLTAGENNDGFISVGPFNDVRLHETLTP